MVAIGVVFGGLCGNIACWILQLGFVCLFKSWNKLDEDCF